MSSVTLRALKCTRRETRSMSASRADPRADSTKTPVTTFIMAKTCKDVMVMTSKHIEFCLSSRFSLLVCVSCYETPALSGPVRKSDVQGKDLSRCTRGSTEEKHAIENIQLP